MTVEVEDVRAWIDGELNDNRAREVERIVSSDEKLQRIASSMRASVLPYQEAYEQVPLPDIPDSLRDKIAALQNPANDPGKLAFSVSGAAAGKLSGNADRNDVEKNSPLQVFGIAASVMLAAVVGYLAGADLNNEMAEPDVVVANEVLLQSDSFAQSVAAYQAFYTRDTLIGTDNSPAVVAALIERLAGQTGMEILIPEFDGYEFVRAQHLSYNGEPLLQLVYLGEEGGPLALCYMPASTAAADTDLDQDKSVVALMQKHYGLSTAEWTQKGRRFVIVSDVSEQKLGELSQSTQKQWEI